jgi:hypothetical protein
MLKSVLKRVKTNSQYAENQVLGGVVACPAPATKS